MPFFSFEKILGPIPIENSLILKPNNLPVIKWPSSWTKIKILKSTEDVLILDFEGKKYFFEKEPPSLIQMPEVEKTQ